MHTEFYLGKMETERSRGEDGSIVLNWMGCESMHWTALL